MVVFSLFIINVFKMTFAPVLVIFLTSYFYDSLLVHQLLFLLLSLGLFPDLRLRIERVVIVTAFVFDFYLPNERTSLRGRHFNFLLFRISHYWLFFFL